MKFVRGGRLMIKAYDFIDIVIRRDSLEKKERGLSQKFIEKYKVGEPHYDDYIICIRGGMNPYDVRERVAEIEKDYGLVFNPYPKEKPITDIVIVDMMMGINTQNDWLKSNIAGDRKMNLRQYYFVENK